MGRQINVYNGPLSPEDYYHLRVRENQFAIFESKRLYGEPMGEDGYWSEDEQAEYQKMLHPEGEEGEPESWKQPEVVEDDPNGGWDPDDVKYVTNLTYEEVQRELKDRKSLEDLPQGREEDLRNELLYLVAGVDDDEEEDENEDL